MDGKPSPSKGSGSKPRTSSGIAAMKAAKRAAMKSSSPSKSGSGDTVLRDPDQNAIDAKTMIRDKTGLVYDPKMLKHANPWDSEHIENPERLRRVHERCQELELIRRCQPIPSRPARDEEILLCHSQELLDQTKSMMSLPNEEIKAICLQRYHSVYMNQDSLETAQLAAGAAVDLTTAVVKGEVQNGMALVRPPGHHAMKTEYCGFCIFNNVAIAARHALNNLGVKRILIVDFDVHHGQATQHEFYRDPRVLYLSLHRYEHGLFWPHLRESDYDLTGEESGKGYNVNIPLNQVGMEDQDYLAVFHQILLPMAYEFQPELVLVSAGYDGALGCPEGEMRLSPMGYDHMIRSLMALAGGKIAVVLEGGYFIESLAEGAALSLRALIGDAALPLPALPMPNDSIMETILNSLSALRAFWKNLRIQEDYNISEYDAATDENCHEPTVIYKGQKSCEIRDLELASYDQGEHYLKHSEETKIKFLSELDDMRRRYLHLLQANPKDKISVVYDESMKRHRNMEDPGHPERPDRISSIYKYLHDYGLLDRDCIERLSCRRATAEEIGLCHDERYYGKMSSLPETQKELSAISDGFDSVYLNPSSFDCALLSAGSLLNVLQSVCEGNSARGCAVIRPPGHHAEEDEACGFCIFNNVPIAAKVALEQHGMERILILDWDVHHGNGIQNMFYDDPRVLYISIHRYDAGTFFPNKKVTADA